VNLVDLHHVNASCKFSAKCLEQLVDWLKQLSECLEQLAESLQVQLSPCVFNRVPGWSGDSFLGEGSDLESLRVRPSPWMVCRLVPGSGVRLRVPTCSAKSLDGLSDSFPGEGSNLVSTLCNY
jgi:hypothetical protein